MCPSQWRQVREIRWPGFNPSLSQVVHGALQIDGVPQDDGGNQQIEAAGSIALILIGTIADFPESVEEHSPPQRILLVAFIESDMAAMAQLGVLQPVEREEGALELSQFTQRMGQTILAGIGSELAQNNRGRHRAGFDRHHPA